MTIPDMRRKGGTVIFFFFFQKLRSKPYSFLQAFVCVSIASPRVHYTKPFQKKKKNYLEFFHKPPEPSWYISLGTEKENISLKKKKRERERNFQAK